MKYALALLLLAHGLLHLAGFSKAFSIGTDAQIHHSISKRAGIFWLTASFLLVASAWLALFAKEFWWQPALAGIILSQVLVIAAWQDAKWGTTLNVIILLIIIPSIGAWSFENKFEKEVNHSLHQKNKINAADSILTDADIQSLPEPVQKYIRISGSIGRPKVKNFKVEFSGRIRKDENSEWMPLTSVQYNFLDTPTRLFFMKATMKHLPVAGYHAYKNGDASMDIRLLSLFKVQYQSGKEMGVAETVTFFNDMVCMAPATLIDTRIVWDSVETTKVHASFSTNQITISAWLYFNNNGELTNFISKNRFAAQDDGTMRRLRWSTPIRSYKKVNGFYIGTSADAIYAYPKKELCYGNFSLTNLEYNAKPK
jgi:hypothetical protein